MGELLVVLNGLPGSGKTTLAPDLARALGMPLVSRDTIKEALADAVPSPIPTSAIGAVAADTMWALLGVLGGPALVESFWLTGRDEENFARGVRAAGAIRGVEVWCEAPIDVTRQRFLTRARHPVHRDLARTEEWERFAALARPISGFPVVEVDTSRFVDVEVLATRIKEELREP